MRERYLAGVELGGTKCICVLGTEDGEVVAEQRLPTLHPAITLPAIEAVLDGWAAAHGPFAALGIASFGPLDVDPASRTWGSITSTSKPHWGDTDLAKRLGARYGLTPAFDTDVVGAALAEGRWGAARGLADFAYVTVGTGVGVGLITGGRPISGFTHAEIGHIRVGRVPGDDWPGICPFHGDCVEGLASGPAVLARMGGTPSRIDPADPRWLLVADAIAQMLHTIVLTASPRRIIIGGGVMNGQQHLFAVVRERLRASLNGFVRAPEIMAAIDTYIVPPALGDRAGVLGALAVAAAALA